MCEGWGDLSGGRAEAKPLHCFHCGEGLPGSRSQVKGTPPPGHKNSSCRMKTAADLLSTSENPRLQWFRKDSLFLCQVQSPEKAVQAFCRSQTAFACSMQVQASLLKVISQGPRAAEASRWQRRSKRAQLPDTSASTSLPRMQAYGCTSYKGLGHADKTQSPGHNYSFCVIVAGRLASSR